MQFVLNVYYNIIIYIYDDYFNSLVFASLELLKMLFLYHIKQAITYVHKSNYNVYVWAFR